MVGYFRSSTLAKEKLVSVQRQLGRPTLKLLQEVETRWNSTYHMLQRLVDLREPVGAALASLNTEITTLTSAEFTTISGCLSLLSGFNDATIELSEEKNVSGSKVVPLLKMLEQMLHEEMAKTAIAVAKEMGEHLLRQLRERLHTLQSMSIMLLATLLDLRFKLIGSFSPLKAAEATKRLVTECGALIRTPEAVPQESPSTSQPGQETPGNKFWHKLDQTVKMSRKTKNATADATVEIQRYLAEPNIGRLEDPLSYWQTQKHVYPNLHKLAVTFLCTPASSVPCERVFSKAGEVVSKKRNRLSSKLWKKHCF
ncbi:hypothetical protein JOQ06_001164 [Pogonophryne albipinna]|uniref:HAT C-terminal dimerisation domain-containing protein n=1 Tax=Pogonophryne albipinna TaxID=1090488 RepID=A0AAD6B5I9_9TELE|nr:hypothetical protein JOQ06_001164 [Pogonophryne albipinna]